MRAALARGRSVFQEASRRAFAWRRALPVSGKIGLAFAMAGVTGLLAQVRFHLPGTPVPVTGQVFAVLLAGVLLGHIYGGLSQVFYVLLGAVGLPWYAGLTGGAAALAGPSGGYLVGFVLAAELIGFATDRYESVRRYLPQVVLMLAGVAVIYLCGFVQFVAVTGMDLRAAFMASVAVFVPIDVVKALLAAGVSGTLLPKPRAGETDAD